jgi:hypothetical protein
MPAQAKTMLHVFADNLANGDHTHHFRSQSPSPGTAPRGLP